MPAWHLISINGAFHSFNAVLLLYYSLWGTPRLSRVFETSAALSPLKWQWPAIEQVGFKNYHGHFGPISSHCRASHVPISRERCIVRDQMLSIRGVTYRTAESDSWILCWSSKPFPTQSCFAFSRSCPLRPRRKRPHNSLSTLQKPAECLQQFGFISSTDNPILLHLPVQWQVPLCITCADNWCQQ